MANSRDFTGKNRKFTGTGSIITPKGTTGQRVGSESGELRFNTTTELMEYYDGTQWKPIDAPPTISNITTNDATGTSTILNADGSTLFTITINGGNFSLGPTVKFIGSTGTEYSAGNVTRVSSSQITCTTLSTMGTTDDPYDVRVTNTSGLSATLEDAFSYNVPPVFVTASGQLGTVYNTEVISDSTFNASATDAEGNTITYSILSGSLPGSGLSLSSSTGMITGTLSGAPSLGNYSFIVQAATTEGNVNRQFSIQVIADPNVTIDFLVIAGGGGGFTATDSPNYGRGAGGAGGYRTSTQTLLTGRTITITVGNGGAVSTQGSSSSISATGLTTITSAGGGAGGNNAGGPGGSGGGAGDQNSGPNSGGTGNTPNTSPSQGNNGGNATNTGGGGGGGAGAGGEPGDNPSGPTHGGAGGAGTASSITGSSVTRAGGGGGGGFTSPGAADGGGEGGNGGGGRGAHATNSDAVAGQTNTGGGGGGGGWVGASPNGGAGGKGVVILSVPTAKYSGTSTGSPTVTTSGSNTILQFNDSGSYTV